MTEPIRIGIAFRVSDEVIAQIQAVDERIVPVPLFGLSSPTAWNDSSNADRDALLRDVATVHILFGTNAVPPEFLREAASLKWFQVITAGVDRLHRDGVLDLGFQVTNVSGLTAVAIAEYVTGAIILMAKGMNTAIQNQAKRSWNRTGPVSELSGATVGILGMGAIGRETAIRARSLGMRVIASRRTAAAGTLDADCDLLVPYSENARLLEQADFLVLCVPLTPETRRMIGADELASMKRSAVIINIARGEVIDQAALSEALRQGVIGGAVLDVTDPEPLPADNELWDAPNLVITPHISGSISGYGHRSAEMFIANLRKFLAGQPLDNLVDPVLGY
jgi:phosphoglycerate dehydrogenase-like enzyme